MDKQQDDGKQFLHFWQRCSMKIEDMNSHQKTDSLRFCMEQLQFLKLYSSSDYHGNAIQENINEFNTTYSNLMDSKSELNNYGEAILHLSKNFVTETKSWKSGLTNQTFKEMFDKDEKIDFTIINEDEGSTLWSILNKSEPVKVEKLLKAATSEKIKVDNVKKSFQNESLNFGISCDDIFDDELPQPFVAVPDSIEKTQSLLEKEKPDLTRKRSFPYQSETVAINNEQNLAHCGQNFAKIPRTDGTNISRASNQYNFKKIEDFKPNLNSNNQRSFGEKPSCSREINLTNQPPSKKYPWQTLKQSNTSEAPPNGVFKTASHQLAINNMKKFGGRGPPSHCEQPPPSLSYGNNKRSLGTRRLPNSKFTPPIKRDEDTYGDCGGQTMPRGGGQTSSGEESPYAELMLDERMKNIDVKMVELIMNEIMDNGPNVSWDDIAGLELAKSTIQEIVVLPMLRPDIFTGIRSPPKGLLLFGPPGTGKTMIGKCIASQSKSTFFSISASSLTSKWVGEGEKMVRAMFAVAKCHQPAVIFIDEIDSLLTQRSDTEHESSRRLKTEFLVQLDGATSGDEERILVVGATNRPQELDEAARRRLVKRLYIPLPEIQARRKIIENLMSNQRHELSPVDIRNISEKADGYSGADMANLCREAALGPIRSLKFGEIQHISVDEVRPILADDYLSALCVIRASVSSQDLNLYNEWNLKYGIKR